MGWIVSYVLPVVYFALLAYGLVRSKWLKNNGFSGRAVLLFFGAKCLAGFVYNYVALKYIPNQGDIWPFYEQGLRLYRLLLDDPKELAAVLKPIFTLDDVNVMSTDSDFIRTAYEGVRFIHFVLNIFSFGNIYTNTILFNGLAAMAFLRCWAFLRQYSGSWLPGVWLFLMPSAFFYSSAIHKEGIMWVLIAFLVPLVFSGFKKPALVKWLASVFLLALFFFFKFFVAIVFFMAACLWLLAEKFPHWRRWLFIGFAVLGVTGFFLSPYVSPSLSLPQFIINRQQEFLEMDANSAIEAAKLEPNFASFATHLPMAINNVLFKPLPGEGGKAMYLVYSVEIIVFWALLLYLAVKSRFRVSVGRVRPFFWGFLVFALVNLLVIGYTIPNIGATMRYRSVFLPFLGCFLWLLFAGDTVFKKPLKAAREKLLALM